jgi:anti-anti-sigma factor
VGGSSIRTLARRLRPNDAKPVSEPVLHRGEGLAVGTTIEGGVHTLLLDGELDERSLDTLERALADCAAAGAETITLDLDRLRFIDSAGLWTITSARRWCKRGGVEFSLVRGPAPIHRIFEVTGLSDVLPFRDRPAKP